MKEYLPGLNTIRLYAALSVVIGHISGVSVIGVVPPYVFTENLDSRLFPLILSGYEAVSLFFVLSGFLITYILLKEKRDTATIAVKRFYIRRALRIQPLYILIVLLVLAIAVIPKPNTVGLVSLALMSPHMAALLGGSIEGGTGHLWSIGVEEWFYFALPPLMKRINVPLLAGVVILLRFMMALLIPDLMLNISSTSALLNLLHALKFESMAIGALGAWLFLHRHWLLRWIYHLEIPALVLMVIIILVDWPRGFFFNFIMSFVFIVFVLNASTNPKRILNLEHRWLSALGNVSYGIYMYHPVVLFILAAVFVQLGLHGTYADIALYAGVVVLSIAVALASYRLFESRFLRSSPFPKNKTLAARLPDQAMTKIQADQQ